MVQSIQSLLRDANSCFTTVSVIKLISFNSILSLSDHKQIKTAPLQFKWSLNSPSDLVPYEALLSTAVIVTVKAPTRAKGEICIEMATIPIRINSTEVQFNSLVVTLAS